ncbi:MAG: N-acetylmuramoyl-L-alanine amidase [Pseudanabaena sp. RU_4_16]|nr:N-acetylmuramoyl-L-alanine amidase [Pseudanabaena sp. RU_4_16]
MKLKIRFAVFLLYLLSLLTLIAIAQPPRINAIADIDFTKSKQFHAHVLETSPLNQFSPVFGCLERPPANPPNPSLPVALTSQPITRSRFRQEPQLVADVQPPPVATAPTASTASPSLAPKPVAISKVSETSKVSKNIPAPKEVIALADSSNYGDRYLKDLMGRPALQEPIIVLHETVGSTGSVMSYFQTFHADEDEQASYHTLITPDGTIVYFVPPDKRAFGAGDSEFVSTLGREAVQTSPRHPRSVNNFAYHIALETPGDGMNDDKSHSGYTEAQYRSLAWLIARTGVPDRRITTHRAVDRSGERIDPRSFNFQVLRKLLSSYPRTQEIFIGCQAKPPAGT